MIVFNKCSSIYTSFTFVLTTFTGDESSAVVEVAPYQGIPKDGRRRKDLKSGTIFKGLLTSSSSAIFHQTVNQFLSQMSWIETKDFYI